MFKEKSFLPKGLRQYTSWNQQAVHFERQELKEGGGGKTSVKKEIKKRPEKPKTLLRRGARPVTWQEDDDLRSGC